jgi:Ca2+-dependent lipid-binding protein
MCRDLPSADEDGLSDSYIEVWSSDEKTHRTKTVEDSISPIFMQAVEIPSDFTSERDAPPVILNVWDEDKGLFDSQNDYLGRA